MTQMNRQRLRITFAKGETLKYISHLDLARAWERALRRAGVPLAYSQGFNPRPKMAFAAALPVGYTATAEMVDILLEKPLVVRIWRRVSRPCWRPQPCPASGCARAGGARMTCVRWWRT